MNHALASHFVLGSEGFLLPPRLLWFCFQLIKEGLPGALPLKWQDIAIYNV